MIVEFFFLQGRGEGGRLAHHDHMQIGVAGQYPGHGGHGHGQTVIAAHGVHGQGHNR